MAAREDQHLPIVARHIESQIGRALHRVVPIPGAGPIHDLETSDGAPPHIAVEVKELVPAEFLATQAAVDRDRGYDSAALSLRWTVLIEEEPLSSRLRPMPSFPEDPGWATGPAATGALRIVSKAEREAEWRRSHTLAPRPRVTVRGLAKDIEQHLATLERYDIRETRSCNLPGGPEDHERAFTALWALRARTHDALCMAREVWSGEQPGVDVTFAFGSMRTGAADVVAERVQMWLDSDESKNLVDSLASAAADERHAALWLATDAEVQSAYEQGVTFCPTLSLMRPAAIDVVWAFLGPLVLRYDGHWSVSAAP